MRQLGFGAVSSPRLNVPTGPRRSCREVTPFTTTTNPLDVVVGKLDGERGSRGGRRERPRKSVPNEPIREACRIDAADARE